MNSGTRDILAEVYLDPLLKTLHLSGIALIECQGQESIVQSARDFPGDGSFFEFEIKFAGKLVGRLDYQTQSDLPLNQTQLMSVKAVADQVAAFLAWTEMAWEPRLEILQILRDLKRKNSGFDWIGLYRGRASDQELILSVFIGAPTEHTHIPVSSGICGAAIREDRTLNIANVRADPRFIACSLSTQSEIVVPIRNAEGIAVAEIDIDSNKLDAFTAIKTAQVEASALKISKLL